MAMANQALIKERFSELKKKRKFPSGRSLVETMKLPPYTIFKILGGQIESKKDEAKFRAILAHIGVTEDEFFKRIPTSPSGASTPKQSVPLYGTIPAGHPNPQEGVPEPDEWIETVPGIRTKRAYALRVHGNSMAPHLHPGDIVYLDSLDIHLGPKDWKNPAPRLMFERLHGRIVAALVEGEATLKVLKLTPTTDNDYDLHLVPINKEYQDIYIRPEWEVRFQGVVVKTLRDESVPALNFKGESK